MMQYAKRTRDEAYDAVIPVPLGWKFIEEQRQVQLAIGSRDIHRFKLVVDLAPSFKIKPPLFSRVFYMLTRSALDPS